MATIALRLVMLFAFAASMLAGCKRTPSPYSSPTALRDTNAYVKAISPERETHVDATRVNQFTATQDGEEVVVTGPDWSNPEPKSDGFGSLLAEFSPTAMHTGASESFEVVGFSVNGPGLPRANTNGQWNLFTLDGRALSTEDIKDLGFKGWQLTEYIPELGYHNTPNVYPILKIWFGPLQAPPGYVRPVGLFDARTKRSLAIGYNFSQATTNRFGFAEYKIDTWHGGPMEFVADVELDGACVIQTNLVPGMTVPLAGGFVRVLGVWDADVFSSSKSSSSGTRVLRMPLGQMGNQPSALAVFALDPPRLPVHLALLNERSLALRGGEVGLPDGHIRRLYASCRASEVKGVQFTVYTNRQRMVIKLPPIPILPVANVQCSNLFEVQVPLITFQDEEEIRDFIGNVTQMRFLYPPGGNSTPAKLFPLALTNVTASELLTIWSRNRTGGGTVVVDEQKQEIHVVFSWHDKLIRWVKEKLRL